MHTVLKGYDMRLVPIMPAKKYSNENCRTMLMRSEVVVIVEYAALTEWEHQKADFWVHTTMRKHSGSCVTHAKYKRKKKALVKILKLDSNYGTMEACKLQVFSGVECPLNSLHKSDGES
jgi:hypothetical protein